MKDRLGIVPERAAHTAPLTPAETRMLWMDDMDAIERADARRESL